MVGLSVASLWIPVLYCPSHRAPVLCSWFVLFISVSCLVDLLKQLQVGATDLRSSQMLALKAQGNIFKSTSVPFSHVTYF